MCGHSICWNRWARSSPDGSLRIPKGFYFEFSNWQCSSLQSDAPLRELSPVFKQQAFSLEPPCAGDLRADGGPSCAGQRDGKAAFDDSTATLRWRCWKAEATQSWHATGLWQAARDKGTQW